MTIYNTLCSVFGGKYKLHKGDIGLEIETESKAPYEIPKFSFWNSHEDGSLRNFGIEYVLKVPLDFEKTFPKALEEFKEKTVGIKFIQDSVTTSVHTHLNFLNDNFITLGNFLTIYSLVENLLIRYSGEDRLSNLFCLPMCDAEEVSKNIVNMLSQIGRGNYNHMILSEDDAKYGAINLAALHTYGSLEIRSFRGTTDTELIQNWVGILYSILKYSRQETVIPPMIISDYKTHGTELLTNIFGPYRKLIRHDAEVSLIEKNFWYAANAAYSIRDWKEIGEVKKKTPKIKNVDKVAHHLFGRPFEVLNTEEQGAVIARARAFIEEPVQERNTADRLTAQYRGGIIPPAPATPTAPAGLDAVDWNGLVRQTTGRVRNTVTFAEDTQPREEPIERLLRYEVGDNYNGREILGIYTEDEFDQIEAHLGRDEEVIWDENSMRYYVVRR